MANRMTYTPSSAAIELETVLRLLEGRWKLMILFNLFGGQVQRFSELEKLIPGVSQKMLAQQLRQLEDDGMDATRALDACETATLVAAIGNRCTAPRALNERSCRKAGRSFLYKLLSQARDARLSCRRTGRNSR